MSQLAKFAPHVILGLLAAVGCSQPAAVDAETLAEYRERFALAEEPDGVQTVADVRVALLGEQYVPHAGHDHAADEHADHAAEDDDDAADHDGHDQAGEDHEGHDHDGEGEADHAAEDHDAADHAGHDQAGEDYEGHDHDGEGDADHAAEDHDAADHAGHDQAGEDHDGHADDDHHDHAEHDHADQAPGTEPIDVNMVGHIGGLANPWSEAQPEFPFAKTQAVLFLADPQGVVENEASGHAHAPGEECVYCASHATDRADMLAMVQFVDENGDVLPIDVRQLFDVKEQDIVVVRGKARVTAGGILVVDAQGLYIRK